ncbi:MAG: hypothetical protein AB8I08_31355 [Sandaracinaceae bacterium]
MHAAAKPHAGKKILLEGSIPDKKLGGLRQFVPEPERILVALDFTMFGSAKEGAVFTPEYLIVRQFEETKRVHLGDVAGSGGPVGMLHDKVSIHTRGGATIHVPCGDHADAMAAILGAIGRHNQG